MSKMLSFTSKYLESFKNAMSKHKMKHYTIDGTLAWGTVCNNPVYVRYFTSINVPTNVPKQSGSVPEMLQNISANNTFSEDTYIALFFKNFANDMIVYVSTLKYIKAISEAPLYDISPDGYSLYSASALLGKKDSNAISSQENFDLWSYIHVPFNNGAKGSLIPILYCIGVSNESELSISAKIQDGVETFSHDIMREIEKRYPKVNLEEGGSRERFVEISIAGKSYIYNRNNVGYNGKSSDVESAAPIIMSEFYKNYHSLISENVAEHINSGVDDEVPYYATFQGQENKTVEKESDSTPKYTVGVIGQGRKTATTLIEAINNMNQE